MLDFEDVFIRQPLPELNTFIHTCDKQYYTIWKANYRFASLIYKAFEFNRNYGIVDLQIVYKHPCILFHILYDDNLIERFSFLKLSKNFTKRNFNLSNDMDHLWTKNANDYSMHNNGKFPLMIFGNGVHRNIYTDNLKLKF